VRRLCRTGVFKYYIGEIVYSTYGSKRRKFVKFRNACFMAVFITAAVSFCACEAIEEGLGDLGTTSLEIGIPLGPEALDSTILGGQTSEGPVYVCLPSMEMTELLTMVGIPASSVELIKAVEITDIQYNVPKNNNTVAGKVTLWVSPGEPGVFESPPDTAQICETAQITPGATTGWTDATLIEEGVTQLEGQIIALNPLGVCIGWDGGTSGVNMEIGFTINAIVTVGIL
jgi:hypothetical protein